MRKILIAAIIILYAVLMAGFLTFVFAPDEVRAFFGITHMQRVRIADWFKFSTIVLSYLTALVMLKNSFCKYDGRLLVLAMFMTVITDVFLTLLARDPSNHVIGMMLYGSVMCIYFMRYNHKKPQNAIILTLFLTFSVILYLTPFLEGDRQRELIIVTTFYIQVFLAVIVSLIKSVKAGRFPKPNAVLLLTALGLFVTADIFVVLANFHLFDLRVFQRFIFMLYTPSQALLAFSSYNFGKKVLTAENLANTSSE